MKGASITFEVTGAERLWSAQTCRRCRGEGMKPYGERHGNARGVPRPGGDATGQHHTRGTSRAESAHVRRAPMKGERQRAKRETLIDIAAPCGVGFTRTESTPRALDNPAEISEIE